MAYGVVYKITNMLNGKGYVGQTIHTTKLHFNQHARADTYIGKAIRKYGAENFSVEVLEECDTPEQLNEREKLWIREFNCKHPNGYNLTDGGEGLTGCLQETRNKMSSANSGENHPFFGKHHSIKSRNKMSESHAGDKNHFFGKHHTNESRVKVSATKRGNTPYKNLLAEIDKYFLSYTALAKILGLPQGAVSNRMCGKVNFTAKDRDILVKFFALPAEYLFLRDDGKNAVSKRYDTPYKNLLAAMDKRKISYAALAKLLELAQPTVSEKMCGQINFTAKDIAKLEEFFGLPAEYLMARADD